MWLEPLNKLNCRQTSDLIKQDPSFCASDRRQTYALGSHIAGPVVPTVPFLGSFAGVYVDPGTLR